MNSRFFELAAIISAILPPYSAAQSLPRSQTTKAPAVQSVVAARAALQPWLRAVEGIFSKTKDSEVGSYLQVLRNVAFMAPSGGGGPAALAQRVLAPPPKIPGPWIGVIIIDSHKDLPAGRWQQLASKSDFTTEYHDDVNTIILRSDVPQVPVMRGLLVVHEMRHWWQAAQPETTRNLTSRLHKEIDAYQTEFRVLDALMLPRYQELLLSERARARRSLADPKQSPIQPDFDNPLLEQTFGSFASPIAKQLAATEIVVRAIFAELDTFPAASALQGKIDLLRNLGYQ
jgi:hypothetical protein